MLGVYNYKGRGEQYPKYMLNLQMLGVYNILEEYKIFYTQNDIEANIKAINEFNRAFIYIEFETYK